MALSRLAFVADEITGFIRNHDSTWALMQAAHKLGHQVFYTKNLEDFLELNDEFFSSQNQDLLVLDKASSDSKAKLELDSFDYIFMRKDPPVDENYIADCKILAECKKAKVINKPESLINLNEKLMILNFPDLIIETIVTDQVSEIEAFVQEYGKSVLKPLDGFGGAGISLLESGDTVPAITETMMLQKYIPDIREQGDKRIIILNGEAIGALLRIPAEGEFRANLAQGGSYAKFEMNSRDKEICKRLKSFLLENGIYFAGIDLIGNYLTEINITSPTCLQEINRVENYQGQKKLECQIIASLDKAS